MQWYYLDGQRQQIQTDEAGLRRIHTEGAINRDTLVWNETLTEWLPLSKALPALISGGQPAGVGSPVTGLNPYSAPATATASSLAASSGGANVRAFAAILSQNAKWIGFLGNLMLIGGILYCITIIGAIIGWLPIWLGIILKRVGRLSSEVTASGSTQGFTETLESIGRFFKIVGIVYLIGLIFGLLYIIAMIALVASGAINTSELQP